MAHVFVSVGSNIDREANVRAALDALAQRFSNLEQSKVYESKAVGFVGDPFYNLVVAFDTDDDPQTVADTLHQIEDDNGRTRSGGKFAARTLDLDLLLYDDLIMEQGKLSLPRDEITKYAFVLLPLAEMVPERRHPVSGKTYAELWRGFDAAAQPLWPVEF